MNSAWLRRWVIVHKWSSLVCTLFVLLLCVTGLPLIFHHEIDHLTGAAVEAPTMPAGTAFASMDAVVGAAQARHPRRHVQFVFQGANDTAYWMVSLGEAPDSNPEHNIDVAVDARTTQILSEGRGDEGFMHVLFKLHVDLFAGLPGKLFLGGMGLLLVVAIVSGVVLYAPFMRKLPFATVRRDRSPRLRWLDLHNLLGIVTLTWALVVGVTGIINTWADLVVQYWRFDQLAQMTAPYAGQPPPERLGSLQAAVQAASRLESDTQVGFIAYPGTLFSSSHHFAVFMRGTEPLTSRLFKPVLVDAQSAQVTDSRELPWYVTALLVSQPLHFGDYGGMPMKVIWAALNLITIVVLWSGLTLWWRQRRQSVESVMTEATGDLSPDPASVEHG